MTIKSTLITLVTAVLMIFGYNTAYSNEHHTGHHDKDSGEHHMRGHHDKDSGEHHMKGRHDKDSGEHHMMGHHDKDSDKYDQTSSMNFLNKVAQQKISALDTFNKLQLPQDEKIIGYKISSNKHEAIITTVHTYNPTTLTKYTYKNDSKNDAFIKNSHKGKSNITQTKLDLKQVLQIVLKEYNNSKVVSANLNNKRKQYVIHLLQSENNIISRQKLLVDADSGEIVSK